MLLRLCHNVAAVGWKRHSLVHLLLFLRENVTMSNPQIVQFSYHFPLWDFVLKALLGLALLALADGHRVLLRLVLDLEQIGGGHLSPCTGGSCPSPSRTSSPISVAAALSSSLALPPSFIQFDESYLKWYVYSLGGSMIKRNIY